MASPRPTHTKRQREQKLVQKRQEKKARQQENRARAANSTAGVRPGEDPDLAGIKPGPQASPWGEEWNLTEDTTEEEDEP
jgi:hypothetical protein